MEKLCISRLACRNLRRLVRVMMLRLRCANFSYDASLIAPPGESDAVNRKCLLFALCIVMLPIAARAATVAASTSIPNGTYTVKVVKVIDAKHVDVVLDNGQEATLPAGRTYVDFSKVQPNDQLKLSLINGNVMVFFDLDDPLISAFRLTDKRQREPREPEVDRRDSPLTADHLRKNRIGKGQLWAEIVIGAEKQTQPSAQRDDQASEAVVAKFRGTIRRAAIAT